MNKDFTDGRKLPIAAGRLLANEYQLDSRRSTLAESAQSFGVALTAIVIWFIIWA